ncbi:MAG TPA: MFS transporter [Nitrososphaeraceae archaeon]|nr:MFS transporter [Nitrososphaeraceae archaeon]
MGNHKDDKKTSIPIRLGLGANINQFSILVLVNAFVGAMIGLEQTVVPLIGRNEFGIESNTLIVSFIASFGAVKAILNLFAGNISDRWGRKNVLVLGWAFGIPVPFILLVAPDWNWIIFANVLLGINQGLAWSMTVNMKIDLVGRKRRGLALGLNEFAGYVSVALVGFVTGYLAATFGLKPYPFYLGIAFALLGLLISFFVVKDTRKFTLLEIKEQEEEEEEEEEEVKKNIQDATTETTTTIKTKPNLSSPPSTNDDIANLSFLQVFSITSWKNRSLLSVSQAGLVNNLVFGVTWGLFTIYFASMGFSVSDIAFLKALHPGIWGALQLVTGTMSDKVGRKILIYPGMIIQGIGIWIVLLSSNSFISIIIGMSFIGIGTALVYPTLLAAISDIAHPKWRATSLGVYRFWRDLGFVFGAIGVGFIADISSSSIAIQLVAWIAIASSVFVLLIMKETRRPINKE